MARMRQKTIICTIHQPSSETIALFDQMILLTRGRLVYSGPTASLPAFFGENGAPVPAGFNIADHALNVINTDFVECVGCSSSGCGESSLLLYAASLLLFSPSFFSFCSRLNVSSLCFCDVVVGPPPHHHHHHHHL